MSLWDPSHLLNADVIEKRQHSVRLQKNRQVKKYLIPFPHLFIFLIKKVLMNSSFSSHLTSVKWRSWKWSQTAAQPQTIWTPAELSWWSMIWIRADRLLCSDTGRMLYSSRFNTNTKHQQDVRAALWCFTVAGRMKVFKKTLSKGLHTHKMPPKM